MNTNNIKHNNHNNLNRQNAVMSHYRADSQIDNVLKPLYQSSNVIMIVSFLINICRVSIPLFIFFTIDIFSKTKNENLFKQVFGMSLLIILLQYMLSRFRSKIINTVKNSVDENIFKHIMDKLFSISNAKIETKKEGFWLSLFNDIDTIKNTLTSEFFTKAIDAVFIATAIGISIGMAKNVAPIIIGISLIFSVSVYIFYRKIFDISSKEKSAISTRNSLIITSIKNISSVKSFVLKDKIKSSWEDYQKNIDLKTTQKQSLMDTLKDITRLMSAVLILGLTYFLGQSIINNKIGIGESILIILMMTIAFDLIEKIIASYPDYLKFNYATERLNNILLQNIDTEKNIIVNSVIDPVLKTKSVFISDKRGTSIINNLDMELHPGTLYIVKGKSTSISSLILKSLAGIYSPESGEIKIDKYNINNIAMDSISNYIRYLGTEPVIFYGTLKENITCFYNSKISPHQLLTFENLLSVFNIKNISENLPQGYNSIIDNNHENLSSEEIKIINIVRTLIGNPSMILIENPFVNLSNENRKKLTDLLIQISKEKLVIITSSNFDSDITEAHTITIKNGEIEIKENEFINKEMPKRRSLFRKVSAD